MIRASAADRLALFIGEKRRGVEVIRVPPTGFAAAIHVFGLVGDGRDSVTTGEQLPDRLRPERLTGRGDARTLCHSPGLWISLPLSRLRRRLRRAR